MSSSMFGRVDHVVTLMLENRSFDSMLGALYPGGRSPSGAQFDGLIGDECNVTSDGEIVRVYPIPLTPDAYVWPGADPGEGYLATNSQLYGTIRAPDYGAVAPMSGFVQDYAYTLAWQADTPGWSIVPGTTAGEIMGHFTPGTLPVLSALAKSYAVCDRWFASVPTETLPNRAFASAATSQGHMSDSTHTFTAATIFGALGRAGIPWRIYGYEDPPLTLGTFTELGGAPAACSGLFKDFLDDAAEGTLPAYSFLEPSWGKTGNSQHPNYNVARGEELILKVYQALRYSPVWSSTLLIVTYDEHGGCYDHVPPPWGATPPDDTTGEFGFGFKRFGPRVPAVLVSPYIEAGSVFRAPSTSASIDHTAILKTIGARWMLPSLTARDAAAPDLSEALTLSAARNDYPLEGVELPDPQSSWTDPHARRLSHLQKVQRDLVLGRLRPGSVRGPGNATELRAFLAQHNGG